jgi:amino acid permease
LALVGATGSTLISYILPGACYYKIFKAESQGHWDWRMYAAIVLFCMGCIIMPVALTFIIKDRVGGLD